MRAEGTFDIRLQHEPIETAPGAALARATGDKVFSGALSGTSRVEMLSARTDDPGTAVYVAIERVTATLDGRQGSFVLHHRGLSLRGTRTLEVEVLPASATGALAGLTGRMTIDIRAGQHFYALEYELA